MSARATYRLQLHRGFGFADAMARVNYFKRLGVTDIYASPILCARAGSTHGYDMTDPTMINPELGGEESLKAFAAALHDAGLGLIVDLVPNHMAASLENPWWTDVLAYGATSAYSRFFDIDWHSPDPDLAGKLLLPILGRPYEEALREGELTLYIDETGKVTLRYGDLRLPLRGDDPLSAEAVAALADIPGGLRDILDRQHYRLAYWRDAGARINWRRFFDINELVALRMERTEVFNAVHGKVLALYAEGVIDGLRIDHVDGLTDPAAYCRLLRQRLTELEGRRPWSAIGGPALILVEKILAAGERLPERWRTDGTTGYDFMNEASAVLHDASAAGSFQALWREITKRTLSFGDEEWQARGEIIDTAFPGQFAEAAEALYSLLRRTRPDLAATRESCAAALRAFLQAFPAYRTYATQAGAAKSDAVKLKRARDIAATRAPAHMPILEALYDLLAPRTYEEPSIGQLAIRLQKLSAPLAAKAVEDTVFYRHGPLLSRNDVGFDAERFAGTVASFHAYCSARAADTPRALSATATHDHKRGEDVRARLSALSEMPKAWRKELLAWRDLTKNAGLPALDPVDDYQLYQTIVGAWPLELAPDDETGLTAFGERVKRWQEKALREAKLRSSWSRPDAAYESAAANFIEGALISRAGMALRRAIYRFSQVIAPVGALNGLTQALLRCLAPGTPDLYQGCEFWDFSLVDPDNRRPVDYDARERVLTPMAPAALVDSWRDGRVKQAAIAAALNARRTSGPLFSDGSYEPLSVEGPRADRIIAFARRTKSHAAVVILPRLCAEAVALVGTPLPTAYYWTGTRVHLPEYCAGMTASRPFEEKAGETLPRELEISDALRRFPAGLFLCTATF